MGSASTRPVVVVDDNEDDIELTGLLLRKAGVTDIAVFRGGAEFLAATPNLVSALAIFLDVKMPGLNGHEVLASIRERREFDSIPVVMWSSSDDPNDILRAARGRAQCYVAKYPNVAALGEIVAEARAFGCMDAETRFRSGVNLLASRD